MTAAQRCSVAGAVVFVVALVPLPAVAQSAPERRGVTFVVDATSAVFGSAGLGDDWQGRSGSTSRSGGSSRRRSPFWAGCRA